MKKLEISKIMLVMVLSLIMGIILSSFNVVRADDDDDIWGTSSSNTSNNTTDDDDWGTPALVNVVENTTENTQANNTSNVLSETSNNTTNTVTNNVNSTTSNANSLAKTGSEDLKGTVAIVLVVCGIVAIYSLKKVKEYKDM